MMSDKYFTRILAVVFILLSCLQVLDALNCIQCNIKVKGANNNCDIPKNVSGCEACLKTYTKIVNHESWRNERSSEYFSKLCIRSTATSRIRKAGCYRNTNNGGYTEQCFCYTDLCNSTTSNKIQFKWTMLVMAAILSCVKF